MSLFESQMFGYQEEHESSHLKQKAHARVQFPEKRVLCLPTLSHCRILPSRCISGPTGPAVTHTCHKHPISLWNPQGPSCITQTTVLASFPPPTWAECEKDSPGQGRPRGCCCSFQETSFPSSSASSTQKEQGPSWQAFPQGSGCNVVQLEPTSPWHKVKKYCWLRFIESLERAGRFLAKSLLAREETQKWLGHSDGVDQRGQLHCITEALREWANTARGV